MKWFRRHIKTGSRLALFALALQFVLSFGHFHFDTAAAAALQGQADVAHAQSLAPDAASPAQQQPSGHDDGQPANGPCAICAVMAMANQTLLATAALVPLPDTIQQSFLVTHAGSALPGSPRPAFQSRAPPVS